MPMADRDIRMQIMLQPEELGTIDDWRFHKRMPSRAAAFANCCGEVLRLKASNLQKTANTHHRMV
jgi:hypothetical protein